MSNHGLPVNFKPRPHVREGLDLAAAITGKSFNDIVNDALEWYLPQIATQEEENRVKLLKEFREKFPVKKR